MREVLLVESREMHVALKAVLNEKVKATLDPLPRMIAEALQLFGTIEAAANANSPTIISWADEVGGKVGDVYKADSIPWCGLFMAIAAKRAGKEVPTDALWALNWTRFGVPAGQPMLAMC